MLPDGRRSTGRARSRRRPDVRLYERQAAAATRGGWSVERDIRWRDIDRARARARPGILVGLRDAALIEAFHPVNLARLLRLMRDEVRHAQNASDLIAKRIATDPAVIGGVLDAAAHFRHFGAEAIGAVPVALPGDPLAIRTFAKRIERLCGVRLVDYLKSGLAVWRTA